MASSTLRILKMDVDDFVKFTFLTSRMLAKLVGTVMSALTVTEPVAGSMSAVKLLHSKLPPSSPATCALK